MNQMDVTTTMLAAASPAVQSTNYGVELIKTLAVFLLAIGVLYALALLAIRRFKPRTPEVGSVGIEVIGSRTLEAGKTLYVVRCRGREWLIAAGMHGCERIDELTPAPFQSPAAAEPPSQRTRASVAPVAPPTGERV